MDGGARGGGPCRRVASEEERGGERVILGDQADQESLEGLTEED